MHRSAATILRRLWNMLVGSQHVVAAESLESVDSAGHFGAAAALWGELS
jgi:hypothetical protein